MGADLRILSAEAIGARMSSIASEIALLPFRSFRVNIAAREADLRSELATLRDALEARRQSEAA